MKTIKITEDAWKALTILKVDLNYKNYSEAIINIIHTAIVNLYLEDHKNDHPTIKKLEKAIHWRRP